MSNEIIRVTQSSMPELDEYVEEIKLIFENKWLTNMGVKHQELEAKLEVSVMELYYSAKYCFCEYKKGNVCRKVAILEK